VQITVQRSASDAKKIEIILDGTIWREVSAFAFKDALHHALQANNALEFKRRFTENEDQLAYRYSAFLLGKRALFAKELIQKLDQAGFSLQARENALQSCKNKGLIDDNLRTEAVIARGIREKKGRNSIKFKLIRLGVSKEAAEKALDEQMGDPQSSIHHWIEKKQHLFSEKSPKNKAKLMQFLLKKGFSYEQIFSALGNL
jgi:SOS response regulatory protein OraA/RecX